MIQYFNRMMSHSIKRNRRLILYLVQPISTSKPKHKIDKSETQKVAIQAVCLGTVPTQELPLHH